MWLYIVIAVLVGVGLLGGVLLGGVFTIVLLPLALIVLISGIVYAMWNRSLEGSAGASTEASQVPDRPLPRERSPQSAPAPSSPEQLADARRGEQ